MISVDFGRAAGSTTEPSLSMRYSSVIYFELTTAFFWEDVFKAAALKRRAW